MRTRGLGEPFALQRLIWLLVGTVVLPTGLLALLAAVSLRDTGAALEERVRLDRDERLQWVAQSVLWEMERLDGLVRDEARPCVQQVGEECPVGLEGVGQVVTWYDAEGPPHVLSTEGVSSVGGELTEWFSPRDGSGAWAVHRSGDVQVGWQVDVDHLQAYVTATGRARYPEEGSFALARAAGPGGYTLDDALDRWNRAWTAGELALSHPLSGWRITVGQGEDPVTASLNRLTILYVAGLIALVITVLVGTTITLVSSAREIRLSRLQTDFVSRVSHELKTPLTSIRLFVDTLRSGRLEDPERTDEILGLLSQESDRLSRRIERVLSWARMEAGRRAYDPEPVAASVLVDEALAAFRTQTLSRGEEDTVEVELPEDLPPLDVDRDAIVEALLNLVQNAWRYTPPPRAIRITAAVEGRRVGLTVSDNGPGIPRREHKRVWERFYQVEPLLNRPSEGSGLGLSIVRAVTLAHGGRVELEAEEGRGSRFTLWLPAA